MENLNFVKFIFETLSKANPAVLSLENTSKLNDISMYLYNKPILDCIEQETLKYLLMSCNIVYNRMDSDMQIISDGMYDILLEKYKKYNSNFQVGSVVVDFNNSIESMTADPAASAPQCPIIFHQKQEKDEIHQQIFDDLTRYDYYTREDFALTSPIIWLEQNASKRLHDTAHNHPSLVGTLDKAKFVLNEDAIEAGVFDDPNIVILERDFFQDHISKGIISPYQQLDVVVELKYDGISVEADCGMEVISARTRGDTGINEAADITNLLRGYIFKHATCMAGEKPIGVKFEAIMTKADLEKFNYMRGKSYSNCRTAIIGLFGALDGYKYRDLITLVPLALDRNDVPQISNRYEEIEFLNRIFSSKGEPLRYMYFHGTLPQILYYIKAFWDEAQLARDYLNFMYDGIVVSYLDENIREKLGRKNSINKYSIAVKFDPLQKQTRFRGYTFEVGQNGQITPMIHYDPVEFIGTIHTKSTGSSYERFMNLGLKYGDYINVTYRNDVMPYVSRLECEYNRNNPNPIIQFIKNCPVCGSQLVLSDSGKTMSCTNLLCQARTISRMTNMMQKLNIKGFADATFKALPEIDHFYKLYNYNEEFYINRLGIADGTNIYKILMALKSTPLKDYIVLGALGFTSIAHKKWKSILEQISIIDIDTLYNKSSNSEEFRDILISRVPNIGDITSLVLANEYEFFAKDIELIISWNNLQHSFGNKNNALQIRFSGCRNLQLVEQLCNNGYDADGDASVTKSTNILLIPYPGFTSNKVTKAMANPDCKIIPISEFVANLDKYLS